MKKNPKEIGGLLHRFFLLNDTPNKIAAGAAVGLFMGILPVESILTSLIITTVFRLNRAAALIGVAVTNIWAMIAVLPLAAVTGEFLFGVNQTELINQFHQTYRIGWGYFLTKASFSKLTLPLLTGYAVVAGLISLLFYMILYFMLTRRRRSQI